MFSRKRVSFCIVHLFFLGEKSMGHEVIYCSFCDRPVMEGHNDWECDCGATCNLSTNFQWKEKDKRDWVLLEYSEQLIVTKELKESHSMEDVNVLRFSTCENLVDHLEAAYGLFFSVRDFDFMKNGESDAEILPSLNIVLA